jgi:hypothetical protein
MDLAINATATSGVDDLIFGDPDPPVIVLFLLG